MRKTSSREEGYEAERPVPAGFAQAHGVLRTLAEARGRGVSSAPIFVTAGGVVPCGFRVNELIRQFATLHGIPGRISSHQFRKFFALFYVRRFRGPIDALRWHFRHVSREMIEAYIKDAVNARYLAEAEAEAAEEIFSSIIHGDGGYALPPPVSRYAGLRERYRAQNLPLEEVEDAIRRVESVPGTKVMAMEWGYCLESKGCSAVAACRGSTEIPQRELAAPTECFACPLFLLGRENVARVRQSLAFHQDVLDSPVPAPRAKRLSASLMARINAALQDLEHPRRQHRPSGGEG